MEPGGDRLPFKLVDRPTAEPMKLMLTSDVHHPQYTHRLLLSLKREKPDILVIVGDLTAGGDVREFQKLFRLVSRYTTLWYVLGNHDLWLSRRMLRRGRNSLDKMESVRELASSYGFIDLYLEGPQRIGDLSLIGVIGWYDYSYADSGYRMEQFLRGSPYNCDPISKLFPCPEWWNDRVWVKLPYSDPEFAEINAKQLKERLSSQKRAIVVMHHVPKAELLTRDGFYRAYHGSPLLGRALEDFRRKVLFVGYGHDHDGREALINGVKYMPLAIPSRDPLTIDLQAEKLATHSSDHSTPDT